MWVLGLKTAVNHSSLYWPAPLSSLPAPRIAILRVGSAVSEIQGKAKAGPEYNRHINHRTHEIGMPLVTPSWMESGMNLGGWKSSANEA